ncbi:50S ribosomal protein L11 [Candidatus Peregrinibacteria bacterium]|nr:50S ribosomal protein L11 [Candidatus Peregrinibacteria bacterium]
MAKKLVRIITIQIPAGKANPAPPIGTALGPTGITIQDFCKQFNEKTKEMGDVVVPAKISIYEDRTFSFILKSPPAAVLIRKAINIPKGSGVPHSEKVGNITRAQLEEIANMKMKDLNANDMDAAVKTIAGTARSMGVTVEG